MFVSLIFSIIGLLCVVKVIDKLGKLDNEERLELDSKAKGTLAFIVFLSTFLVHFKYKNSVEFLFYFYLSIYLIIIAYIDYNTKKVYCILNKVTILVAILFMTYHLLIGRDISNIIISLVIYIFSVWLLFLLKTYADGDKDIYMVIGYFVASLSYDDFPLIVLTINMIMSNIVLIVFNIRGLSTKFEETKKKRDAFVPAIAMATILVVVGV